MAKRADSLTVQVLKEIRAEIGKTNVRLDALREETNGHFERIDGHFERIDGHFDRIDGHFDRIDGHFDGVDARFDEIDARFGRVNARFDEIDARFGRVNARFDVIDERFERVDVRFERIDARLDHVGKRVVESEIRTATAITDLAGTVHELTAVLKHQPDLRPRVERCELDIADLKRRVPEGS